MSFMYVSGSKITEKNLGSTSKGPRAACVGTTDKMDVEHPVIDDTLVRRMVAAQFPQWADLPVRSAEVGGRDNKTFRLGEHMIVRLPSAGDYSAQVEKEHRWLPKLAPLLPLPERIADLSDLAASLAQFLIALQRLDPTDGPPPGPHNFWRGGSLTTYDAETRQAIALLEGKVNTKAATEVWERALKTTWNRPPVWLHGDVSAGNLLVKGGRLSAVIDFGMLGVGDPACDLSIAWTLFSGESRKAFRAMLPLDAGTWARGRAWTLWKVLIVAAGLTETNAVEAARPWRVIDEVLEGRSIDT